VWRAHAAQHCCRQSQRGWWQQEIVLLDVSRPSRLRHSLQLLLLLLLLLAT
jgi:hypothetical protein